MKDRITQFLNREGISPAEFADKIGVQRSSVSHVLNGRNYPSASFIQKMLDSYKTLNPRWLLLGEGAMSEIKSVRNPTEATLFSQPSSPETPKAEKEPVEYGKFPGTLKPNQPTDNLTDTPAAPVNQNQTVEPNYRPPLADMLQVMTDNKEVEKIVLFFKDKTFTSYTPSK